MTALSFLERAKTCRVSPLKTRARYFLSRSRQNTCIQAACEEIKANAPVIRAWMGAVRGSFGALGCFSIIDRWLFDTFCSKNDSFRRCAGPGGARRAFRGARVVDDVRGGCGTGGGIREAPNRRATPPKEAILHYCEAISKLCKRPPFRRAHVDTRSREPTTRRSLRN